MKIVDIIPETENQYFCCLEEWSDEMKEAGDHKQKWYEHMKNKGVRVKFAVDENNIIGGMIQYVPIEHSMFNGENLYVILCIWVHGYKQGRGNYRNKGMGTALLKAAEEDCQQLGANGLVTWGLLIPVFMRASWFKKHGYKVVDKQDMIRLLWKTFNEKAIPPKFVKHKKLPDVSSDKINISLFKSGWCPAQNITYERVLRATQEHKEKINIQKYDTTNRDVFNEWGVFDGVFIDTKELRTGPPPSFEKIQKKINKKVKKIN